MRKPDFRKPPKRFYRVLNLVILFWLLDCFQSTAALSPASGQLSSLVQTHFAQWDLDHDGNLTAQEINQLIESPSVTGSQAAALVAIRSHWSDEGDTGTGVPAQQV